MNYQLHRPLRLGHPMDWKRATDEERHAFAAASRPDTAGPVMRDGRVTMLTEQQVASLFEIAETLEVPCVRNADTGFIQIGPCLFVPEVASDVRG